MGVRAGLGVVVAGVVAGELVGWVWEGPLVALLALPLVGLLGGRRTRVWLAVATAAIALGAVRVRSVARPSLPRAHVARLPLPVRTVLVGRIVSLPQRRDMRLVLVVEAEAVGRGSERRPACGLVRVAVRHAGRRWRYGERLRVEATLRRPRNFENPGRFDYVGHLARRGIHATAFVWDENDIRHLAAGARGVRVRLERWRARLVRRITAAVPAPEGAVLAALVVGDESGIEKALRDAFTRTGLVHVLSISGLHVGLVAAAVFACARWTISRSERLLLRLDVARLAAALSIGPVALYAALAGLGVATLRSAFMVAAVVLAGFLGRTADVLRSLALAALVLALVFPGSPLDIAFQLSFVSVLAIVCGMRRLAPPASGRGWRPRLRDAFLASCYALVGTAPLTAFHFHQVSLVGVLANPLVLPLFGAAVVIPGLCGAVIEPLAPAAATLLFRGAALLLRPGIALVRVFASPACAALDVPIPSLLELVLLYGVLGGLALGPRRGVRVLVVLALVALAVDAGWWVHRRFGTQSLRVTFLDVGQGDAAVAELPGGTVVVVDAGGFPGGDFDTGAAVVSPFLLASKIRRIDVLAMTHADHDHAGGLPYLLAHHHPREFWWTGVAGTGAEWARLQDALGRSGSRTRILGAGDQEPILGEGGAVLHPAHGSGPLSLNDSSLTVRLGVGARGVLLTGDIEARAEQSLLATPGALPAAVLKVPHHGSRTSSTPPFIDAVAPRFAVISVGADNRYGLPAADVETRYRRRGTCVLRTDRCGAITVEIDGERLTVQTVRPGCRCPAGNAVAVHLDGHLY